MQETNLVPIRPTIKLFFDTPNSDLADLFLVTLELSKAAPEILEMIDHDLDTHGIEKKRQRLEDKAWLESRSEPLPGFDEEVDEEVDDSWLGDLSLQEGRPRMPAIFVLLFMMVRGYLGGFKKRKVCMIMLESKTLESVLWGLGLRLPGLSTLIDNVNALRTETRESILDAQIRMIVGEGLDDFKDLTFDSTDVAANSRWPTESDLIARLSARALHLFSKLRLYGISVRISKVAQQLQSEIERANKEIGLLKGRKNSNKKRAKLYRRIFRKARKLLGELTIAQQRIAGKVEKLDTLPSQQKLILQMVEWIEVDLKNLKLTTENANRRINKDEKVSAAEKFYSLSDEEAAMIVKGGREPTFGYKPQVGRSAQGFVTGMIVPEGNASDSGQLKPIVEASIARTGVTPDVLSFDDGYTNMEDLEKYKALGIEVSFSGAKGKSIIPSDEYDSEEYQITRAYRSAVESLMFTLKHNHDFDFIMRRGLDAATDELLEKVITYNLFRIITLRRRQEKLKKTA